MQVWNYLKLLYSSKHTLAKHVSLFSIVGLLVLAFIKYTASYGNLLLYHNFYITVPSSAFELWLYLFFVVFLFIYLAGYILNLANNIMNERTNILPEFSLKPFYYFIKVLPFHLCWNIYFILLGYLIYVVFNDNLRTVLLILMPIFIFPFVLVIQTSFIKKLKYDGIYFKLSTLFKVIGKSFFRIIILGIQMIFLAALPAFALFKLVTYSIPSKFLYLNLPIKLGSICLMAYIVMIFVFVCQVGLCNISEDCFKDFQD